MSEKLELLLPNQQVQNVDVWNLIFLSGEITEETGADICNKLLGIDIVNQSNGTKEPVNFIINSPGGDLHAAWQICDVMDFIQTPVHTVGMGQVCSAGLIILMNGEPGERRVTDRTSIMSHVYESGTVGNHNQLLATTKEYKNVYARMVKHYEECTGLDKKVIEGELLSGSDMWLTGSQAKKYNLIDTVVSSGRNKRLKEMKKKMQKGKGK